MATAGLGLGLRLVRGICKASALDFELEPGTREFNAIIRFQRLAKPVATDTRHDKTLSAK